MELGLVLSPLFASCGAGVAAVVAGHLVSTGADGKLVGFENIGYVVIGSTLIAAFLTLRLHRGIRQREAAAAA